MNLDIQARIDVLATMDLEATREEWRRLIGPPPKLRSVKLLQLHLAWRLQAHAWGELDAELRRALRNGGGLQQERSGLHPGARLTREWLGIRHEVEVTDDGFTYRGETYRSLSKVARLITGARWNGPRFFGLREARAV
jgi:hypothetical protein